VMKPQPSRPQIAGRLPTSRRPRTATLRRVDLLVSKADPIRLCADGLVRNLDYVIIPLCRDPG
jgi:hypothetical protein